MKRSRLLILGFLICIGLHAQTLSLYPFDSPKKEAQFHHLLKDLRCLVCQNQDLSDSHAELAQDLRNEVYRMVQEGKSDTEVYDYLTARYGDFILFNPPIKAMTYLLWFGPLGFLILGLWIFMRTFATASTNLARQEETHG